MKSADGIIKSLEVGGMMYKELKAAILNWLLENETQWQRVNACKEAFREYIYNKGGNYLIGGETVAEFIEQADKLIYGRNF